MTYSRQSNRKPLVDAEHLAQAAGSANLRFMPKHHSSLRRAAQALAAFILLASLLLICTVSPLEEGSFLKSDYFRQTRARLEETTRTNFMVTGPLRAGFGRARLSPMLGAAEAQPTEGRFTSLPLAGYGDREGRPAAGSHDDLFVKAVALQVGASRVVLASADLLIVPREIAGLVTDRALADFGLQRDRVYLGATHTHASLGGWGEGFVAEAFAGKFQPGVREWIAECFVNAIRQSLTNLQPATFREGAFRDALHVRNRLVGELGQIDPDFTFLAFTQEGGTTAVVGSYAAHATVLPGRNMEFSGDYPGAWQRAIETRSNVFGMFFAGSVGSHAPVAGGNGFEHVERMGTALAQATFAQLELTVPTNIVSLGLQGLTVDLPQLHVRVTDSLRLRPWLARELLPVSDHTFMQAVRLNQALWVSTPCDYSGELALDTKSVLARSGLRANITSFNGDYIGYLIPGRYYHMGGYEPRVMSFFGPAMPDYLDHLIWNLASRSGER